MKESELVKLISRKLAPYILLFGLYLISYGHISPGGGFQGGVVLASGVILLCLARGLSLTRKNFSFRGVRRIELTGFLFFLLLGFLGLALRGAFLSNIFPLGKIREIPSAGFIFFLNLIIGLKVGAGIILISFVLFEWEEK